MDKFLLNKQLQAEKLKNLQKGQVPVSPDSEIPMVPAPLSDISPEEALKLDEERKMRQDALSAILSKQGRMPASEDASVADMTEGSDMIAVPMEDYQKAGAFQAEKGMPGQEASPDVSGMSPAPEMDDKAARLAKIKALFQNR